MAARRVRVVLSSAAALPVTARAMRTGLALGSVGCGSGGAPSGMAPFAERGLVLDYPSGWKKESAGVGRSGQVLNVRGLADAHGLYVRATLFRQPREYSGIGQYGKDGAQTRLFDLVDGRGVFDGPLSVPGASDGGWIVNRLFLCARRAEVSFARDRAARAQGR